MKSTLRWHNCLLRFVILATIVANSLLIIAQSRNQSACPDTVIITLDNYPPPIPPGSPWIENNVLITIEDYAGPANFQVDPGGFWLWPATLKLDFSMLQKIVIRSEVDVIDYCGLGCTVAKLYDDTTLVSSAGNLTPTFPETLVLRNTKCDTVDFLTVSSYEAFIAEIRLIIFCVSCPSDTIFCENDSIVDLTSLGATPGVGSFTDANGDPAISFDPSTSGLGDFHFTYSYTDPDSGCTDSCMFTISVHPYPEVTCPTDMPLCENDGLVTFTASPSGGSYSGPGVTGDVFDPSQSGVGTFTIQYCYTDPDSGCESCCDFVMTVLPKPDVQCPSNMELCIDGDSVTLTASTPDGTFSGPGITGDVFDPADAGEGTHTIEYCFTDVNECEGCCTFNITVHPLPFVTCDDLDVCIDDPVFVLTTGNPAGGTYSGDGVVGDTFDPAAAGSGYSLILYEYTDPYTQCEDYCYSLIYVNPLPDVVCPEDIEVCVDDWPFILEDATPLYGTYSGTGVGSGIFDPWVAQVGVHNIRYDYYDPDTGCYNYCTFNIIVHPQPAVYCPPDLDVCINDPPFYLIGAIPEGGSYNDIFSNPVSPFDPIDWGVGAHTIYYDYTDPITGCYNYCTFQVIVHPSPPVICPPDIHVCYDTAPFDLTGGTPPGGSYTDFFGNPATPFNPAVWGPGTHTIYYKYTNPSTDCSDSCNFTISVHELPQVTCPISRSVCENDPPLILSGAMPMNGVYSGAGVTLGIFYPAVAGVGTTIIFYTYTDQYGCTSFCQFSITVKALPAVTCPSNIAVCIDHGQMVLSGGFPANGVYSGSGVTGNLFDPASAGIGNHNITYAYTDPGTNCSNSCSFSITVHPKPNVVCPSAISVALVDPPFMLSEATPFGGDYNGPGVSGGLFYPAVAGIGNHTIFYSYSDANECSNFCSFSIRVMVEFDYGDAPDGAHAYPATGEMGHFPTCTGTTPPGNWIRHANNSGAFFGSFVDYETDGNGASCPLFTPGSNNQDECYQDGDAGLIIPGAFTIIGSQGYESIIPCSGTTTTPLGDTCNTAVWGTNIDIEVRNFIPDAATAYINLLIDWNQNGIWDGDTTYCSGSTPVLEHVLINFQVGSFIGNLSSLAPPSFIIGPNSGFVWARFTISEQPVQTNWAGTGIFEYGETEDYLFLIATGDEVSEYSYLNNIIIPDEGDTCFAATTTITVAGGGSSFVVQDGGSANLVAGQNILLYDGTTASLGGYLHARISTDGNYCENPSSMVALQPERQLNDVKDLLNNVVESGLADVFFQIYPNPTTDKFIVALNETSEKYGCTVEIYGLLGEQIAKFHMKDVSRCEFDLSDKPAGIYFLKAVYGDWTGVRKLVKK